MDFKVTLSEGLQLSFLTAWSCGSCGYDSDHHDLAFWDTLW